MRVVFINVCVVLAAMASSSFWAQADDDTNEVDGPKPNDADEPSVLRSDIGEKVLRLMNTHFQDSLKYMYTSKQYGSQYFEQPGMAKYLKEASDYEWEQGLEALKKYMQRGGTILDFRNSIQVNAKGEVNPDDINQRKCNKYAKTFKNVWKDSKNKFVLMNEISSITPQDPEISHYLDGKLSKEAERMYECKIYETMTKSLKPLGLGLKLFDESL